MAQDLLTAESISVLVVDDDVDHRLLMQRHLADAGLRVRTVGSGEEALEHLDGIDLVLLDYRLPGMSGLEALAEIRTRGGPAVMLVTALGSEAVASAALRSGAVDYLVKKPGYVAALPAAVLRAWRQHDLAQRADELQRLALLVTSGTDRDTVLGDIVAGTRRLLRADGCALYLVEEGTLRRVAMDGDCVGPLYELLMQSQDSAEGGEGQAAGSEAGVLAYRFSMPAGARMSPTPAHESTEPMLVPLPSPDTDPVGVLEVCFADRHTYAAEEVRLAEAFASFAGIALGNIRRLELERALVTHLQEAIDARRQFLASISHELRTPLTCVMGFSETLLENWERFDDDNRLEFLQQVRRHAGDLASLVEQLLDVAVLESGQLQASADKLALLPEVKNAVDGLSSLLSERPVVVDVPAIDVVGDSGMLRRILHHLLSNAVKYSDPGTPVTVAGIIQGDVAVVSVTDRGVGMTEEEAVLVFEPFWRASGALRQAVRGTGVGLMLVREYVRAMRGTVSVRSAPNEGSTFSFTLPLA